jgi:signal transduction histidine kinase
LFGHAAPFPADLIAALASEPGQVITVESQCRANRVMIAVTDQGKGIADEHLSKIFEPFFTTKMVGEGTGLGLSLTYNIIQEHGGSISVDGSVRSGCRFEILLPGIDPSMVAEA